MASVDPHNPTVVAGQYEVVRPLGSGSFGHTYLAHDRTAARRVAIKLLDPRSTGDWKTRARFEREAAVLRSLRHHGIPEVYALLHAEWEGAPASLLVMEYVEGVSLSQLIEEARSLDPSEVVSIFLEQLGILEYLHARVPLVLHRDIKPSNIILRPNGLPALVDFGSVRRVFLSPDEAGSMIAGTYGYMPYEQYMGQASPASDLYALGATFLHLLTGRPPRDFMTGEGRIEVPETLSGAVRMRPILARLLLSSPADRFQSARDVRQALLSATAVMSVAREPPPSAPSIPTPAALMAAVPRPIRGDTAKLLKTIAPTALQLMDGSAKPSDRAGLFDWASLAVFSFTSCSRCTHGVPTANGRVCFVVSRCADWQLCHGPCHNCTIRRAKRGRLVPFDPSVIAFRHRECVMKVRLLAVTTTALALSATPVLHGQGNPTPPVSAMATCIKAAIVVLLPDGNPTTHPS